MVRIPGVRVLLLLIPIVCALLAYEANKSKPELALYAFAVVGLAGLLPGALAARPLQQKLEKIREAARVVSAGDLDRSFPADREDAAGQLGEQLEELRKSFRTRI